MTKQVLTERDLNLLEERLKSVFITKEEFTQYKSEHFDKLDEIVTYTKNKNEEVEIIASRQSNHEDRISNIESILNVSPAI